jgi:hypothetical protein
MNKLAEEFKTTKDTFLKEILKETIFLVFIVDFETFSFGCRNQRICIGCSHTKESKVHF